MGRRTRIAIALVAALPVLIGVVAWLVETDEEAIERVTDEARRALVAGEQDPVIALLTPDAAGEGRIGRGPLGPRVAYWTDQARRRLEDLTLSLRTIEVEGNDARAEWAVQARLKHGEMPRRFRFLLRLDYRRTPAGWRISHADAGEWSL